MNDVTIVTMEENHAHAQEFALVLFRIAVILNKIFSFSDVDLPVIPDILFTFETQL